MPLKKLKPEEKLSTTALIEAIEQKDRRFRLFQLLFMVITFIALIFIISAQQRTIEGVRQQLVEQKAIAEEDSKRSDDSDDKIIRRLDCMTVFFSQRDRTNLTIENIDKCTLNRDGDLQEFFTEQPGEQPETTREQQPDSNLTPSTPSNQGEGATPAPATPVAPQVVPNPQPEPEFPTPNVIDNLLQFVRELL